MFAMIDEFQPDGFLTDPKDLRAAVEFGHEADLASQLAVATYAGDSCRMLALIGEASKGHGTGMLLAQTAAYISTLQWCAAEGLIPQGVQGWLDEAAVIQMDAAEDGDWWLDDGGTLSD